MSGRKRRINRPQKVKVPAYIEDGGQGLTSPARMKSPASGYTPYYGPDVAAFSPMQQASFQNTADTASAFGLSAPASQQDIMGGIPAPTTYAGGVSGLTHRPRCMSSHWLSFRRSAQRSIRAIMGQFIDPVSEADTQALLTAARLVCFARRSSCRDHTSPRREGNAPDGGPAGRGGVGYTGARDMFDGGGPNASTIGRARLCWAPTQTARRAMTAAQAALSLPTLSRVAHSHMKRELLFGVCRPYTASGGARRYVVATRHLGRKD